MDLRISFGNRDMVTPIYVKMDAPDPLLLSEGVCRQLGVVCYHDNVHPLPVKSVKEKLSKQERSVGVESHTGKLTPLPAKDVVPPSSSGGTPPIQNAQREEPAEGRPEEVEMAARQEKSSQTIPADHSPETVLETAKTSAIQKVPRTQDATPNI